MVGQERWEEIRRLFFEEKLAIAEIVRRLAVDRKTVRRWIRKPWLLAQPVAAYEGGVVARGKNQAIV